MTAQVEVAAVGNAFQFAEFAGRQEGKSVFDIGRSAGIVGKFGGLMLAQAQAFAG